MTTAIEVKARVDAALALCEQECRHPLCDFHAWLSKQPIEITAEWVKADGICVCDRSESSQGGQCSLCYARDRACGMCGDTANHAAGAEDCSLVERFDREQEAADRTARLNAMHTGTYQAGE